MTGKIIKGISGFYYIHTAEDKIYSCRAVGIFRKLGIKPLVGDNVDLDVISEERGEGSLTGIHERRNVLIRPAVSTVDQALIVFAVREPDPNLNLLDRFLVHMGMQDIPVVVYFNKADLDSGRLTEKYTKIYEAAGYTVISGSTSDDGCIERIKAALEGKTTVLAGPSGVGKSSLTNKLYRKECMEVGELSQKIKRGKQTTRHTELFMIDADSYVLDTPGFTSLNPSGVASVDLEYYFNEFKPHILNCKFTGCSHIYEAEDICGVKQAVASGDISSDRYDNYCQIFSELKEQERR